MGIPGYCGSSMPELERSSFALSSFFDSSSLPCLLLSLENNKSLHQVGTPS